MDSVSLCGWTSTCGGRKVPSCLLWSLEEGEPSPCWLPVSIGTTPGSLIALKWKEPLNHKVFNLIKSKWQLKLPEFDFILQRTSSQEAPKHTDPSRQLESTFRSGSGESQTPQASSSLQKEVFTQPWAVVGFGSVSHSKIRTSPALFPDGCILYTSKCS